MVTYKRGSGNYKSSYMQVIVKASNQTENSNETMVDDSHLKLVLRPSVRYTGYVVIQLQSGTTPDMDVTMKDITGATEDFFYVEGVGLGGLMDEISFGTEHSFVTDGSKELAVLHFSLLVGAAGGTLQFQFAQGTSDAGNTTVYKGSYLVVFNS